MMGWAVIAGEAAPIHAENYRQLLQADVMDDGIEGTLQEGRIDGAEWAQSSRRHARGKDYRVLFRDADVEVAG